jgi:hypothetical protein
MYFDPDLVRSLAGSGFEWISLGRHDIAFDIHPKGKDEVNDQRGAHGQEGNIYKPCSYPGGRNAQTFANGSAHTEYLPLNELLHSVHTCNLKKIG